MDPNGGRIYTPEEQERMMALLQEPIIKVNRDYLGRLVKRMIPMTVPPTGKQMARRPPKVGRNEPCPCGSGKKFKKCCLRKA